MPFPDAGHTIRRLPLPHSLPPFDDELGEIPTLISRASITRQIQGTLALSFNLPNGLPAVPEPSARLCITDDVPVCPLDELPDPAKWAARIAQAALECLYGPRPLQQLMRWTSETVYSHLAENIGVRRPLRPVRGRVRVVRTSRPRDEVVEASVAVQVGVTIKAVALRLEAYDDRWMCTALDVI